jgi:hypothetical protein
MNFLMLRFPAAPTWARVFEKTSLKCNVAYDHEVQTIVSIIPGIFAGNLSHGGDVHISQ